MAKVQWNQKLTPEVYRNVDTESERQVQSGKIKDKGDFIGLCFDDYLVLENRRNLYENGNTDIKEGLEYLDKLHNVMENIHTNYQSEISRLKRQIKNNESAYEETISNLEQEIVRLNKQLEDKIYDLGTERKHIEELNDIIKGHEKLINQNKGTNNKKSAAG